MKIKPLDKDTYKVLSAAITNLNEINELVNEAQDTITKILCYHTSLPKDEVDDWVMDCVYNGQTFDSVLKSLKIKVA